MSSEKLPYSLTLPSGAKLVIAPICTPDQVPNLDNSMSQKRQCERYTWHKVAREILNDEQAEFQYNEIGAPQISGSKLHISVSHSSELVAVMISPNRCAVDIESLNRNFDKVASRYISEAEATLLPDKQQLRPLLWSIKEALYKFAGRKEIDLLKGIKVSKIENNQFTAQISPNQEDINGTAITIFNHTLAYIS